MEVLREALKLLGEDPTESLWNISSGLAVLCFREYLCGGQWQKVAPNQEKEAELKLKVRHCNVYLLSISLSLIQL